MLCATQSWKLFYHPQVSLILGLCQGWWQQGKISDQRGCSLITTTTAPCTNKGVSNGSHSGNTPCLAPPSEDQLHPVWQGPGHGVPGISRDSLCNSVWASGKRQRSNKTFSDIVGTHSGKSLRSPILIRFPKQTSLPHDSFMCLMPNNAMEQIN